MDPRIRQKRIPTLLAVILLTVGVGVAYFLIQRGTVVVTRAMPDYTPQNVRVSNVTDSSFVVSFTTADPTVAAIQISGTEEFYFDAQGADEELESHYFELEGLESEGEYNFTIVSHQEEYESDDYSVVTAGSVPLETPENKTLSGSVVLPEGGGAKGAIVYLSVPESQLLSTLTDKNGEYSFDFSSGIRTKDLRGYVILEEGDSLSLSATQGTLNTDVLAYYSLTLPTITLGRNFDFTDVDTATIQSSESASLPLPSGVGGYNFTITSPTQGDSIIDMRPSISGSASPSTRVFIEILPVGIEESVEVEDDGGWRFRPSGNLSQGENTITATGVGADNVSRTIQRTFSIFPDGSQVSQSATPSATPTVIVTEAVTPTPTAIPSTPTPSPTPQSIGGENPTPSPTLSPTSTITPFLKVTPTPPGDIGGILLTFASLVFIVTGATLLFLLG